MKRYLKSILTLIAFLLMFSISLADQHDKPSENQTTGIEEEERPPEQPSRGNNNESTDAFVPTETISEDLSVPFPVDI
jgi:hypothetical protein